MAALLGLGIGTLNCVLFGFFPTWKNIWGVLTRPLFLVSGVFFTFNSAPPAIQDGALVQPARPRSSARCARASTAATGRTMSPTLYVFGIALSLFVIGAYLLRRHASFLIEQ